VQLESQIAMSWPQPFALEAAGKLVVMRGTNAAAVHQYRRLSATLDELQVHAV
jgi:hypothetical protein